VAMRTDTMSRRRDIFRDAIAVITEDYGSDLTVESVAHTIGTSRRQLQRVFDEVGGASFRQVLTRVRMQNASMLLRETDTPVASVARQVGYSQPAQFAKTFRRLYGDAPSVYRTSPRPAAAASHPLAATTRPSGPVPRRYGVGMGRRANSVQVAATPL
jgi:AraC family transcriptional regulator, regulatory protein of adaptative response / methylphosphotriester-DNA alkyltransferase methyltransferase